MVLLLIFLIFMISLVLFGKRLLVHVCLLEIRFYGL
jgi:hypothetical protein